MDVRCVPAWELDKNAFDELPFRSKCENFGSSRGQIIMRHPVRTLLHEFFVEPVLQLLHRAFGGKPDATSKKTNLPSAT